MQVFVFGNSDIEVDALPVRILPKLRKAFPAVEFVTLDPNENWDVSGHMVVIDTVVNATKLTIYRDLKAFMAAPRLTCHDFDAYANIMLMKKIGEIDTVSIIGIPPSKTEDGVLSELIELLKAELGTGNIA